MRRNRALDPEAGHRGQAVFCAKGTPGLSMLRKLDKLGCRASHTGEIVLEDCRVPSEHRLGGAGGRGPTAPLRRTGSV